MAKTPQSSANEHGRIRKHMDYFCRKRKDFNDLRDGIWAGSESVAAPAEGLLDLLSGLYGGEDVQPDECDRALGAFRKMEALVHPHYELNPYLSSLARDIEGADSDTSAPTPNPVGEACITLLLHLHALGMMLVEACLYVEAMRDRGEPGADEIWVVQLGRYLRPRTGEARELTKLALDQQCAAMLAQLLAESDPR